MKRVLPLWCWWWSRALASKVELVFSDSDRSSFNLQQPHRSKYVRFCCISRPNKTREKKKSFVKWGFCFRGKKFESNHGTLLLDEQEERGISSALLYIYFLLLCIIWTREHRWSEPWLIVMRLGLVCFRECNRTSARDVSFPFFLLLLF